MEAILKNKNALIVGGSAIIGALWYFSGISSKDHEQSTVVEPDLYEKGNYFRNPAGMWIYTRRWIPKNPVQGLVFIVHGHGEHINRPGYQYLANQLMEENYAVFGIDFAGHGRSSGTRGHVPSCHSLCDDLQTFIRSITQEYPDCPKFAIGHSMGGLVVLNTVVLSPKLFDGVILSAPVSCIHLNPSIPSWQKAIFHSLSLAFPKFQAIRLDMNGLTSNPDAVDRYLNDPLINRGYINLCTFDEALRNCRDFLWNKLPNIVLPIYIVHGIEDTLVKSTDSEVLYAQLGTKPSHKKLWIPEHVKHEPWEDPKVDQILDSMKDWLSKCKNNSF